MTHGAALRHCGLELLEDRRLLSIGGHPLPIEAELLQHYPVYGPMPNTGAGVADSVLDLVGGPHGKVELGEGEMLLLATGPAPSELRIRVPNNVNAADTTNVEQIQPGGSLGLNLTGNGYTVGVWDAGSVRDTHQEFGNRVTNVDSASVRQHSTHVAGTIAAAGIVADAEGMATEVNIRSRNWDNDVAEMDADADLIQVSNHSYGYATGWHVKSASDYDVSTTSGNVDVWFDDRSLQAVEDRNFGKYRAAERDFDQVLYDNPYLLSVWAAGNDRTDRYKNTSGDDNYVAYFSQDPGGVGWSGAGWYLVPDAGNTAAPPKDGNGGTGYDSLSGQHNGKNTLLVGAVNDVTDDPYTSGQIQTTSYSSYGPTDDGRVKPDVVGNGSSLYSTDSGSDTDYRSSSGTSMATPNVSGTAVLLIEHFENEFGFAPQSASTKGVLIHTAADAGNVGPDYAYGWGLVDGAAGAQFITAASTTTPSSRDFFYENDYDGTDWTTNLFSDGNDPLKATIAWTDPAPTALPGSGLDDPTPMLVHDLDLWIAGPDGNHYPWTLDPANPTDPAVRTAANHVDNVEQVLIDAPIAGAYTIHVGAAGFFTQAYSLMISGAANTISGIDLRGTAFDVTPDTLLGSGGIAMANFQIENQGDTPAGAFDVRFYLSDDADIDPVTDILLQLDSSDPNYIPAEPAAYHVTGLTGSQTYAGSALLTVPTSDPFGTDGDYYLGMFVDADQDIAETSEANNRNRGLQLDQDDVDYLLFFDDFSSTSIDTTKWTMVDGATVDDVGEAEPSAPYSLRMNADPSDGDTIESKVVDLSSFTDAQLSYFYQRTGNGDSPESGDDLVLEYWDGSQWVELERQPGSGPDMTQYSQSAIALPVAALHPGFRFRFKSNGTAHAIRIRDDWFVDDVKIKGAGSVSPYEWQGGDDIWMASNWRSGGLANLQPPTGGEMIVDVAGSRVRVEQDFVSGGNGPAASVAVGENETAELQVDAMLEVTDGVAIGPTGTLSGTGTVDVGTHVQVDGTLAPGGSIGTLTAQGDVVMTDSSAMTVQLSGSGTAAPGVNNDVLAVGNLTLTGNPTLELEWLAGEVGDGLFGGIYTIATYSGNLVGTFATPTLSASYDDTDASVYIDTTYGTGGIDYGSGTNDAITVKLKTLLVGDANLDGDVDVFQIDGNGDAQLLGSNLDTISGAVWGDGDFNFDGDVDVFQLDGNGDAQLLSQNLGTTSDVALLQASAEDREPLVAATAQVDWQREFESMESKRAKKIESAVDLLLAVDWV